MVPSVQTGEVAIPFASVVTVAGDPGAANEPFTAVKTTETPDTGFPAESRMTTDGAVATAESMTAD